MCVAAHCTALLRSSSVGAWCSRSWKCSFSSMASSEMLSCLVKRASLALKGSAASLAAAGSTGAAPTPSGVTTAVAAPVAATQALLRPSSESARAAKTALVMHTHGYRGISFDRLFSPEKLPKSNIQVEFGEQWRRLSAFPALFQMCCFPPDEVHVCHLWSRRSSFGIQLHPGSGAQHRNQEEEGKQTASAAPLPAAAVATAAVAALALLANRRADSEKEDRHGARRRHVFSAAASRPPLPPHDDAAVGAPVAARLSHRRTRSLALEVPFFTQQQRPQREGEKASWRSRKTAPARCAASREGREVHLGNVSDFERGSLYELKIDDAGKEKVLLAHLGSGEFYCVGATCTHYAAPLVKGGACPLDSCGVCVECVTAKVRALCTGILTAEDRVVCPWHDAEFDVKTGKCLNGPALDGLPCFPVSVREGQVFAFLPNDSLPVKKRALYTQRVSGGDADQTFVIVGGGAAAAAAVETLRAEGFAGRIVLVSKDKFPPYDRTILSKNLLAKPDNCSLWVLCNEYLPCATIAWVHAIGAKAAEVLLTPPLGMYMDFLERELGVELWLAADVEDVNFAKKTMSVRMPVARGAAEKKTLQFDKLLLCTGTAPRSLSHLPNGTAQGIFTLRSLEDHQKLQQTLEEICKYNSQPRVVIVGSSFIGVEGASAFKRRGFQHVTLVGKESVPLEGALGSRVGEGIKQLLVSKGVKYLPKTGVKGFTASGGRVTGVELDDGDVLQADLVLLGIGGEPCTRPFHENITAAAGGAAGAGIAVDPLLRVVGLSDVFAAGDIASYPYVKTGETVRVEHWNVAMQQGRVAAANMLGQYKPFTQIPFFWSAVFGKSIRFAGSAAPAPDEVIVEGDLEKQQFVAYYVKNDRVVAVCTMNRDPVAVAAVDLLAKNLMPSPGELRQGFKNSADLLAIVHAEAAKSKKRLVN